MFLNYTEKRNNAQRQWCDQPCSNAELCFTEAEAGKLAVKLRALQQTRFELLFFITKVEMYIFRKELLMECLEKH